MMSLFNVLKSKRVSPGDVRPFSLDPVLKNGAREENAVFHKSWDPFCQPSDPGIKDSRNEREKAITIIEEAQVRAQLIEKEAYEKAFSLGQKEGLEVAERRLRSTLESLEKAHGEFKKLKEEIILRSERELIALCMAIARKVLSQEIVQNKDALLNLIRCGLRYVLDKDHVRIRLHPSAFQQIMEFEGQIISSSEDLRDLAFEKDERIARGDVVIETRFGNVDCRLGSVMTEIEKSFQQALAEKEMGLSLDDDHK
jgi:flagellar biosynthesis/type III secretory pathway protein FliH